MQSKDGRHRTASSQETIRIQVIDFLKKKRGSQQQAADIFGLHVRSVNRMWHRYRHGGGVRSKPESGVCRAARKSMASKQRKSAGWLKTGCPTSWSCPTACGQGKRSSSWYWTGTALNWAAGRWAGIWKAGATHPKSPFAKPLNKSRSR